MKKQLLLQRLLKPVFRFIFRVCARVRVEGVGNLPPGGGYILFSNHISWFDPEIVGAFIPVPIHYMTMEGLFKFRPLGFLLKKVGAFPVRRQTADRRAIEEAMGILSRRGVIFIFPEGGIRRLARGEKLRQGISLIAQCADAPLIPVGLSGCRGLYNPLKILFRRVFIELRIGRPFHVRADSPMPAKKVRELSMKRIKEELFNLAGRELAVSS